LLYRLSYKNLHWERRKIKVLKSSHLRENARNFVGGARSFREGRTKLGVNFELEKRLQQTDFAREKEPESKNSSQGEAC